MPEYSPNTQRASLSHWRAAAMLAPPIGAIVLAKMERGEFEEEILMNWMDKLLSRDDDRRLFGLNAGMERR